jgi:hypothetical protein
LLHSFKTKPTFLRLQFDATKCNQMQRPHKARFFTRPS